MAVACMSAGIPFSEIDLQRLDEVINTYIPSGFSIHEKKVWSNGYLEVNIKNLKCINVIDVDMALRSVGTLGGGNHFIEVNKDKNGKHWLVIHSGSRNLGKRVCEYWQKVAEEKCMFDSAQRKQLIETLKAEGRQDMIEKAIKELKPKVKDKGFGLPCRARRFELSQRYGIRTALRINQPHGYC